MNRHVLNIAYITIIVCLLNVIVFLDEWRSLGCGFACGLSFGMMLLNAYMASQNTITKGTP